MSDEFVNTYLDDKYFYGKDKNEDLIKQMELAYLYHKDKEKKEKSCDFLIYSRHRYVISSIF